MPVPEPIASPTLSEVVFDVQRIRQDFPILRRLVHGKQLAYLDNAATSQKPQCVLDALVGYYGSHNSNVHRGVHTLSEQATARFEEVRELVRAFINARSVREIVFVRGTTEGINLAAATFGRTQVRAGDEVLITGLEHHSNIVPWQILCEAVGARLRVAPIDDRGEVIPEEYQRLLGERTKIVAVAHVSNALGTINPVRRMIHLAHERGIPVLVDGAQGIPHLRVDVQELDCDFYVFSSHKMYGPTGVGILYAKESLLEAMPPYQAGGDMIKSVTFEKTIYNDLPYRFEAGTPNIADAIGLGAAIEYLKGLDWPSVQSHEYDLLHYAEEELLKVPGLRLIGTAREKASVVSFVLDGIHPHDIGTVLDQEGIAIRTGHHCAQPVMMHFGVPATARASFAFYNTREEIDRLVRALFKTLEVFG